MKCIFSVFFLFFSVFSFAGNNFLLEGEGWDWVINFDGDLKYNKDDDMLYLDDDNYMIVSQEYSELSEDEFLEKAFYEMSLEVDGFGSDIEIKKHASNFNINEFDFKIMRVSFIFKIKNKEYLNDRKMYVVLSSMNGVFTYFYIVSYDDSLEIFANVIKNSHPK